MKIRFDSGPRHKKLEIWKLEDGSRKSGDSKSLISLCEITKRQRGEFNKILINRRSDNEDNYAVRNV